MRRSTYKVLWNDSHCSRPGLIENLGTHVEYVEAPTAFDAVFPACGAWPECGGTVTRFGRQFTWTFIVVKNGCNVPVHVTKLTDVCKADGVTCRCCGKPLTGLLEQDGHPIHTRCIPRHWSAHVHGKNASRCREFGRGRAS